MEIAHQMKGRSLQNQISGRGLFVERLRYFRTRTQALGQCICHIGEGITRPAGDDELAFVEQRFRLMPLGDVGKSIHADQHEKLVAGLE